MRNVGLLISTLVVAAIVGWMVSFGPKDTLRFRGSRCAHATSALVINGPDDCRVPVKVVESQNHGAPGAAPRR
jgi:hypothetical protein